MKIVALIIAALSLIDPSAAHAQSQPYPSAALCSAFGTTAGSCAQGNDSRIVGAAQAVGPTAWTPTDQSGATLTFANVSAEYTQIGNMVFAYGRLTYPTTANTNAAIISLPVAVPNQNYANGLSVQFIPLSLMSMSPAGFTVKNTSTFGVQTFTASANVTNANLSGVTVTFVAVYPAS